MKLVVRDIIFYEGSQVADRDDVLVEEFSFLNEGAQHDADVGGGVAGNGFRLFL